MNIPNLKDVMDKIVRMSQAEAKANGGCAPRIIVFGSKSGCEIKHQMPDTHEGRLQMFMEIGKRLAQEDQIGTPMMVIHVTEAWMSKVKKGEKMEVMPSQDPRKQEVLIVSGLSILESTDGSGKMRVLTYTRDASGKLIDVVEDTDMSTENEDAKADTPLLMAVLMGFGQEKGYLNTNSDTNNPFAMPKRARPHVVN